MRKEKERRTKSGRILERVNWCAEGVFTRRKEGPSIELLAIHK